MEWDHFGTLCEALLPPLRPSGRSVGVRYTVGRQRMTCVRRFGVAMLTGKSSEQYGAASVTRTGLMAR